MTVCNDGNKYYIDISAISAVKYDGKIDVTSVYIEGNILQMKGDFYDELIKKIERYNDADD